MMLKLAVAFTVPWASHRQRFALQEAPQVAPAGPLLRIPVVPEVVREHQRLAQTLLQLVAPSVWPLVHVGPEDERQRLRQERLGHVRVTEQAQAPFLQVAGSNCFENFFWDSPSNLFL